MSFGNSATDAQKDLCVGKVFTLTVTPATPQSGSNYVKLLKDTAEDAKYVAQDGDGNNVVDNQTLYAKCTKENTTYTWTVGTGNSEGNITGVMTTSETPATKKYAVRAVHQEALNASGSVDTSSEHENDKLAISGTGAVQA